MHIISDGLVELSQLTGGTIESREIEVVKSRFA